MRLGNIQLILNILQMHFVKGYIPKFFLIQDKPFSSTLFHLLLIRCLLFTSVLRFLRALICI